MPAAPFGNRAIECNLPLPPSSPFRTLIAVNGAQFRPPFTPPPAEAVNSTRNIGNPQPRLAKKRRILATRGLRRVTIESQEVIGRNATVFGRVGNFDS